MNNTLSKLMNKFIIKIHHFIVFEDDVLKTMRLLTKIGIASKHYYTDVLGFGQMVVYGI